MTTRILGIDPGSRLCGWGVVDCVGVQIIHVDNGVVVLGSKQPLGARLGALLDAVEAVLSRHRPHVVAVEAVFQHRNPRSALILGQARGVVLAAAARAGLTIHDYTPQQVKKAVCGSGRADKEQVQKMVSLRLGLPDLPQEDAADAVAVAICHAQSLRFVGPDSVDQPPRRRRSKRAQDHALAALVASQRENRR
jgi:crossover junction endodeoxyribonuclease RuvC